MHKTGLFHQLALVVGLAAHALTAAAAGTSGVTYQGRILRPDGSPLNGSAVQFKLQIRAPDSNNCLMYEELQTQDMHASAGLFSLTINDGSGTRLDSSGYGLDRIFANRGTFNFSPATCSSGSTYIPGTGDGRNFVVLFKDETMSTWEPIPTQKLNFVPLAFESKQVQGFTADSLLRVVDGSGDPLTGLAPLSNAQYTSLMALVNGSSSVYSKAGELRGSAVPAINTGEVLGWNGTAWVSQSVVGGANSVTTAMIQDNSITAAKLDPTISISTSGTIASAVTTTRDFKIYAASPSTFYVGMVAPSGLAANYTLTWPLNAGTSGQVLTTNGSGVLTWTTPSSAGITALTGDVTATGPGSAAATVASVGGSTATQVHTAELAANAATTANTASTIVKRDASGNFAAGAITATSVQADALKVNNAGSVVNIVNPTGAAYTLTLPTGVGTSGQVLTTNGAGVTSWTSPLTSSTGFVQGGNTFGAIANLGTNDNFDLRFRTNGATAMTLSPAGYVGIGTTAPFRPLTVNGSMVSTSGTLTAMVFADGGAGTAKLGSDSNHPVALISNSIEQMRITPSGSVGIGTTVPATKLEVAGSVRVGDGGETCDAAHAGAIRYNGGNLQFCAGAMPWTTLGAAGSGIASLTGDVTATGPGAAAATVASVGGSTAAQVHSAELLANAATETNTASAIVKRDGAGGVAVGAARVSSAVFRDSGSNTVSLQAPATVTTSYILKLPTAAATSNQLLQSDSSGNTSWVSMPTALPPNGAAGGDLSGTYPNPAVATVGTSTAANIHSGELAANAATASNTVGTIVKRDGLGNFSATDVTTSSVQADTLKLNNAGSVVNVVNPIGAAYTLTLPTGTGTSGQVLSTNGSGVTSWTTPSNTLQHFAESVATAAPNTSIPVATLQAVNAAADVDVAIEPKGSGAFLLSVPDGLASGGNKRGLYAVDLQLARTTNTQVASGDYSVLVGGSNSTASGTRSVVLGGGTHSATGTGAAVVGGSNNTASNTHSFVAGGLGNTASGQYSAVIGSSASGATGMLSAVVAGNSSTASGHHSFATGYGSLAQSYAQVAIGRYGLAFGSSTSWVATDPLFSIGNGTSAGARANALTVLKNGDVGVGTTSPNGKLDVKGSIVMSGATSGYAGFQVPAAAGSTVWTLPAADGTSGQLLSTNGAGILSWVAAGGTGDFKADGSVAMTGAFKATNGSVGLPSISFASNADTGLYRPGSDSIGFVGGGVERMRMQAGGNVGIGTTSPAYKLDVAGDVNVTGNFKVNGVNISTGGGDFLKDGSVAMTGPLQASAGTAAAPSLTFAGDPDTGFYNYTPNGVSLSTAGVEKFRFGNNGSFTGVAASYQLGNTTSQTAPTFSFHADPNTGMYQIASDVLGFTTNGAEKLRINATGDVGIGSTAPNGKLDVKGSIVMSGATSGYTGFQPAAAAGSTIWTLPSADGTANQVLTTNGAGVLSWSTASGGSGDFMKDGSVAMTGSLRAANGLAATPSLSFASDTNTGFYTSGTNDGSFEMSLDGIHAMSFNVGQITSYAPIEAMNGSLSNPEYKLAGNSSSGTGMYSPGTNAIGLSTNGADRIRVTSAGNVGVGTTAPNGKLDVKGSFVMSGATSGYTGFQPAAAAGSTIWTLPSADGTSGQLLSTNGAGVLSWVAAGGTGDFKKDGSVAMTGALKLPDGAAGAPSMAFADDTDTGFYSPSNGTIALQADGATILTADNSGHFNMGYNGRNILSVSGSTNIPGAFVTQILDGNMTDNDRYTLQVAGDGGNVDLFTVSPGGRAYLKGNVGVGTTSPNGKLDVKGSVVMSGATSGYTGFMPPATATNMVYTLPAANPTAGQVLSSNASGVLSWVNGGGSSQWTTTGSDIYYNGKVGINQSSPSAVFDMKSQAASSTFFKASASTGSSVVNIRESGASQLAIDLFDNSGSSQTVINSNGASYFKGSLGVGVTVPNGKLDVKGSIVMSGATSGYTGFQAPAAAGSTVWTLPSADGTSNQVLTTNGSGVLSWSTPSSGGITALTGDVTASGTGSVAATVANVGGVTAANVAAGANLANAATSANTNNAIVKRDGSGNFVSNIATFNGVSLYNAGSTVNITNPIGAAYNWILPTSQGTSGQVLSTTGSGSLAWINPGAIGASLVLGTGDGTSTPGSGVLRGPASTGNNVTGADLSIDASNGTGTGGSGNLLFRTASPAGGLPTLTLDASKTNSTISPTYSGTGSIYYADFTHTVGVGSNRILIAAIMTSPAPTAVTYGGQAMTAFGPSLSSYGQLYYLLSPPTGLNTLRIQNTGAQVALGSVSYFNAHQTTPFRNLISGAGSFGSALNVTNATSSGEVDFEFFAPNSGGTASPASGETTLSAISHSAFNWYLAKKDGPHAGMNYNYGASTTSNYVNFILVPSVGEASDTLTERMRIDKNGNVGIGTAAPASKLQVNGTITNAVSTYSGAYTCGSTTLDFSTSNFQRLSPSNTIAAGSCTVTLSNLVAGGSYTLIVTGNAATNAVTYAFGGYTFKYLPVNAATTAGKDTIYTFLYDGTNVYVTWTSGY